MPYVDPSVIANIFRSLRGRFGNAFVDKYRSGKSVPAGQPNAGKDTGLLEAMDVWGHELRELSAKDIEHGLSCKFKYPPSADEFVQACCTREITPPMPDPDQKALSAPRMSREQAEVHIAQVRKTANSMRFPSDNVRKLDWAYQIAEETAAGAYRCGYGQRMAAEAFYDAGKPVPESLVPFLAKANPMEQAA